MQNKTYFFYIAFIVLLSSFFFGCKTNQILNKPNLEKPKLIEQPKKDPFLGVFVLVFPNSKKRLQSYAVEFHKNKTARVLLFKKGQKKPTIIKGKYLFLKENKNIIVLYFPKNIPSEYFLKNKDGTLSILDENKKPYKGVLGENLILKKIDSFN